MAKKNEVKGHENVNLHIRKETLCDISFIIVAVLIIISALSSIVSFGLFAFPPSPALLSTGLTKLAFVLGLFAITGWLIKLAVWLDKKSKEYS